MRLDLLYALRMLRQSPGFAATAILTLALGIGANAAVFSVIDSVLLRPLPFRDPGRLVLVSEYSPGNVAKTGSPLLRYQARAAQNTVFEQTAAYWDVSGGNGMVFGGGSAERLEFSVVTNGFFPILGVQPAVGRAFSPAEERPGGGQVFVASFAAWQRLMGGDPAAIGRSFRLDGAPYTLIGVLPRDFHFPGACALWLPAGTLGTWPLADRVSHQFWMLGRLRRGVSPERAQADMDRIQDGLAKAFPATDATWRVRVRPLLEEFVGGVRASLWILLGAVAFVLLIACANVVNLMLARAAAREREFAMRAALGAPRLRLFRQALTETLLLVIGGAGLALLLAEVGLHALSALGSGSIPRLDQPHLSLAVLWFCGGLALATTLLVGAAPGLASGRAAYEALKGGQRTGSSRRAAGDLAAVADVPRAGLSARHHRDVPRLHAVAATPVQAGVSTGGHRGAQGHGDGRRPGDAVPNSRRDGTDGEEADLSSLRIVFVSGSGLGSELAERALKDLGPVVYNMYGSTEVSFATIAEPKHLEFNSSTAGPIVKGVRVKIFDENGKELPQGEVGRIFVGTSFPFEGYTGGGNKQIIDGMLSSGTSDTSTSTACSTSAAATTR